MRASFLRWGVAALDVLIAAILGYGLGRVVVVFGAKSIWHAP